MRINQVVSATALIVCLGTSLAGFSEETKVKITPQLDAVEVKHGNRVVTISRDPNPSHTIDPAYAKTSRACPPFCIQPMQAAPGVETIGELEVLDYLKKITAGDNSILVVDSRTSDWLARGTIPGSVNIPWTKISREGGSGFDVNIAETIDATMQEYFGAVKKDNAWNFDQAKTLVLYCNGMWCPQSSLNIQVLLKQGYPAAKIKWYRGGMQDWDSLGLTVVKPDK
jgi:rhodanese-related sulfurtransferase